MINIINYLKQPSTLKGLTILATAFCSFLSPELNNAIITAGASIYSVIEIIRNEKR
jgi:hypothetical protein